MGKTVYDARIVYENGTEEMVEGVVGPQLVPSSPPMMILVGPFGTTKAIFVLAANTKIKLENPQVMPELTQGLIQ